jgi:hypothetical protein
VITVIDSVWRENIQEQEQDRIIPLLMALVILFSDHSQLAYGNWIRFGFVSGKHAKYTSG